jgi:hypothetical protein
VAKKKLQEKGHNPQKLFWDFSLDEDVFSSSEIEIERRKKQNYFSVDLIGTVVTNQKIVGGSTLGEDAELRDNFS